MIALLFGSLACQDDSRQAAPPYSWNYRPESSPFGDTPGFKQVAAGAMHACAIGADDEIVCVGRSEMGETAPPPGPWRWVWAGRSLSCGLRHGGGLRCWGAGATRNGIATLQRTWPTSPPLVVLGLDSSVPCGLDANGHPHCYYTDDKEPFHPTGAFDSLITRNGLTCAHREDGTGTCWNFYGEKGSHKWAPPWTVPDGPWADIVPSSSPNGSGACGLRPEGAVECWGSGPPTELAQSDIEALDVKLIDLRRLAANSFCGRAPDHRVHCTRVGPGWPQPPDLPLESWDSWGQSFACGLDRTGRIHCWGRIPKDKNLTSEP